MNNARGVDDMRGLSNMFKSKRESNQKGFTLVELIVVLVILAILAAILVPALLGYIDRARGSQLEINAKSVLTAAQAELSSQYGKNKGNKLTEDEILRIVNTSDIDADEYSFVIYVAGRVSASPSTDHDNYTVSSIVYTQDGKTITFNGSSWAEENSPVGTKNGAYVKK